MSFIGVILLIISFFKEDKEPSTAKALKKSAILLIAIDLIAMVLIILGRKFCPELIMPNLNI